MSNPDHADIFLPKLIALLPEICEDLDLIITVEEQEDGSLQISLKGKYDDDEALESRH